MINVTGKKITMTRGDTFRARLTLKDTTGAVYEPEDGDVLLFTVKRNYNDSQPVIQKEISHETMLVEILPDETKKLRQPSALVYDVQLIKEDGTVDTFIDRAPLAITEEVG